MPLWKNVFEDLEEEPVEVFCAEMTEWESYYSPGRREYEVRKGAKRRICSVPEDVGERITYSEEEVLKWLGLDWKTIAELEEKWRYSKTAQEWLKNAKKIIKDSVRKVEFVEREASIPEVLRGEKVDLRSSYYILVREAKLPKPDLKKIEEEYAEYWRKHLFSR